MVCSLFKLQGYPRHSVSFELSLTLFRKLFKDFNQLLAVQIMIWITGPSQANHWVQHKVFQVIEEIWIAISMLTMWCLGRFDHCVIPALTYAWCIANCK